MNVKEIITGGNLPKLRETKPLIEQVTNYITINDCANVTLAIGASPIMGDNAEEMQGIIALSGAVVLNYGTFSEHIVQAQLAAGKEANKKGIPVVFDPVGVGISEVRNEATWRVLDAVQCSVIRGNISEIRFIADNTASVQGVDASEDDVNQGLAFAVKIAKEMAQKHKCTIAITGAVDIISDGERTVRIENGHPMLSSVTGTGCMCNSLIASYNAVSADAFSAAVCGIATMGIAGEIAFEQAGHKGTGSFRVALIDAISQMSEQILLEKGKIHET